MPSVVPAFWKLRSDEITEVHVHSKRIMCWNVHCDLQPHAGRIRKAREMQETEEFVMCHVGAQRGTDSGYHGKKRVGVWFSELYMQGKTNPQNRMMIFFSPKVPRCCINWLFIRARLTWPLPPNLKWELGCIIFTTYFLIFIFKKKTCVFIFLWVWVCICA